MRSLDFRAWLYPTPQGLYCEPGDFHIDPAAPVPRAVITHGHSDHARPGHAHVYATPETIAIMRVRMGHAAPAAHTTLRLGERIRIGDVSLSLHPAGHVLGSAQVLMEYRGARAVVSGDYKRRTDPTAVEFEPIPCHLFVTEATFALPVFRHEPDAREITRLLTSLQTFPDRTHLVGAYGLGKCQRLIALLRAAGYDRTIYLHGAMTAMCDLYQMLGVDLGHLLPVNEPANIKQDLPGEIVMVPPSALGDRWSRRFNEPVTAFASGWMRVRARARQRGVELPLVISDHADWPELIETIRDTGAEQIWVTHGREDALVRQCTLMGLEATALRLVGREEEAE